MASEAPLDLGAAHPFSAVSRNPGVKETDLVSTESKEDDEESAAAYSVPAILLSPSPERSWEDDEKGSGSRELPKVDYSVPAILCSPSPDDNGDTTIANENSGSRKRQKIYHLVSDAILSTPSLDDNSDTLMTHEDSGSRKRQKIDHPAPHAILSAPSTDNRRDTPMADLDSAFEKRLDALTVQGTGHHSKKFILRHSNQLLQSDKDALADITRHVTKFTKITEEQFYAEILEGYGTWTFKWNSTIKPPTVAPPTFQDIGIKGHWIADCTTPTELKKVAANPSYVPKLPPPDRRAGRECLLKIHIANSMASVVPHCAQRRPGDLDNVALPPGRSFAELIAEALYFDDSFCGQTSHLLAVCVKLARTRLWTWYNTKEKRVAPGGRPAPVYTKVPNEPPLAGLRPVGEYANNISIALGLMAKLGAKVTQDADSGEVKCVLPDGRLIGPGGMSAAPPASSNVTG